MVVDLSNDQTGSEKEHINNILEIVEVKIDCNY